MTPEEQKQKLDDIARRMKKKGADMDALNREIDTVLGIPSEPKPDEIGADWERANR